MDKLNALLASNWEVKERNKLPPGHSIWLATISSDLDGVDDPTTEDRDTEEGVSLWLIGLSNGRVAVVEERWAKNPWQAVSSDFYCRGVLASLAVSDREALLPLEEGDWSTLLAHRAETFARSQYVTHHRWVEADGTFIRFGLTTGCHCESCGAGRNGCADEPLSGEREVITLFAAVPRALWEALEAAAHRLNRPVEALVLVALHSLVDRATPAERSHQLPAERVVVWNWFGESADEEFSSVDGEPEPTQTVLDQPDLDRVTVSIKLPGELYEPFRCVGLARGSNYRIVDEAIQLWLQVNGGDGPPEVPA